MNERGWNQVQLARSASVSDDAVSRLINNGSVSIAQIARIARALGQPVSRYVTVEAGDEDHAKSEGISCGTA